MEPMRGRCDNIHVITKNKLPQRDEINQQNMESISSNAKAGFAIQYQVLSFVTERGI